MIEPEKYLPMNRAELIARCEAQEAVLRKISNADAPRNYTIAEMMNMAAAALVRTES